MLSLILLFWGHKEGQNISMIQRGIIKWRLLYNAEIFCILTCWSYRQYLRINILLIQELIARFVFSYRVSYKFLLEGRCRKSPSSTSSSAAVRRCTSHHPTQDSSTDPGKVGVKAANLCDWFNVLSFWRQTRETIKEKKERKKVKLQTTKRQWLIKRKHSPTSEFTAVAIERKL